MILLLLLLCVFVPPAHAAWEFISADKVDMADNAVLTLPDADWSICGWFQIDSNTGSATSSLVGWGGSNATPSLNTYCREASNTAPNTITLLTEDATGDADQLTFNSSGTPCATTTWQHYCLIRTGTAVVTMYLAGASIGTDSDVDYDALDLAVAWVFGTDGDGAGVTLEDGNLAEWAKWDRALTAAEMTTLQKYAPHCLPGARWYAPMVREYIEVNDGLTVTNTGTTVVAHPPLLRCY